MGLGIIEKDKRPVRTVSELIKESLFTRNPYLDLSNCGLTGAEKELEMLADCEHVETLVFSNRWEELVNKQSQNGWERRTSQNGGEANQLTFIPDFLPQKLKKLILFGNKISDITHLDNLTTLEYIDLGSNSLRSFHLQRPLPLLDTLLLDLNMLDNFSISANTKALSALSFQGNQLVNCQQLALPESLKWLDLSRNSITGSANLRGLVNLNWLYLNQNQLVDISALAGLTRLNMLALSRNQIADISPLGNLVGLKALHLNRNLLSTIRGLGKLQSLELLDVQDNLLVDLEGLPSLSHLEKLNAAGNKLSSLKGMPDLPGLKLLDLTNNKLRNLEGLPELPELEVLRLRGNKINSLSGFQKTQKLATIDLAENRLTNVRELPGLPNLTTLNLENNKIDNLEGLRELPNLTSLNLEVNQLTGLAGLRDLPKLTLLNLKRNKINSLVAMPELAGLSTLHVDANQLCDLAGLPKLTELETLTLSGNKLTELNGLREMPNLISLDLSDNVLSSLEGMPKLPGLTLLDLWNNKLRNLEGLSELPELTSLYLGGNQFKDGDHIRQLEFLDTLHVLSLFNNPLIGIPREKLGDNRWTNCLSVIKDYFRATSSINLQRPLNEAKLIFVGLGDVGKTELAAALSEDDYRFQGGRGTTKGIHIKKWRPRGIVKDGKSIDFTVNIWDFAGQEINYGTHQFFLTKNSVYVFVWDYRKGMENTIFQYWLGIVSLLSENSPILVVQNKVDINGVGGNERVWRELHSNICGFYKTSCKLVTGIDELRQRVQEELLQLPHTFEIWNRDRFAIREHLEAMNYDYISHREYLSICTAKGVSREQAGFLSIQLHQIGVILHFPDELELKDTVVLRPEWATNAVYEILDSKQISNGRFSTGNLHSIWSDQVNEEKHGFLLALMEKFELIFRFNDSTEYIVPELLPVSQPELPQMLQSGPQSERYLRFEYHYEFMPKGIMSRFICRQHKRIKDDLFWKFGVVLESEYATALVIANETKQVIRIEIVGRDAEKLLFLLRSDFQDLHKKLKNPKLNEKIPCVCSVCNGSENAYMHTYDTLQLFRDKGRVTKDCDISTESVAIKSLLEGIWEKTDPFTEELDALIEQNEISDFFARADEIGQLSPELIAMRDEFVRIGARDFQFAERLLVASRAWRRNLISRR